MLAAIPKLARLNSYHAKITIDHVPVDDVTSRCQSDCNTCKLSAMYVPRNTTIYMHSFLIRPASSIQHTVVDDDIVFFCAANTRYITSDIQVAPLSHFSDGLCDIYIIRKSKTSMCTMCETIMNIVYISYALSAILVVEVICTNSFW